MTPPLELSIFDPLKKSRMSVALEALRPDLEADAWKAWGDPVRLSIRSGTKIADFTAHPEKPKLFISHARSDVSPKSLTKFLTSFDQAIIDGGGVGSLVVAPPLVFNSEPFQAWMAVSMLPDRRYVIESSGSEEQFRLDLRRALEGMFTEIATREDTSLFGGALGNYVHWLLRNPNLVHEAVVKDGELLIRSEVPPRIIPGISGASGKLPLAEGPRHAIAGKALHPPYLKAAKPIRNDSSGRLDAGKVKDFFGLSWRDLASILKLPNHQAVAKTPDAASLQEKLQTFARIMRGRLLFPKDDAMFRQWLNTPNEEFATREGRQPTPMDFIKMGHPDLVAGLVDDMLTGHPS